MTLTLMIEVTGVPTRVRWLSSLPPTITLLRILIGLFQWTVCDATNWWSKFDIIRSKAKKILFWQKRLKKSRLQRIKKKLIWPEQPHDYFFLWWASLCLHADFVFSLLTSFFHFPHLSLHILCFQQQLEQQRKQDCRPAIKSSRRLT